MHKKIYFSIKYILLFGGTLLLLSGCTPREYTPTTLEATQMHPDLSSQMTTPASTSQPNHADISTDSNTNIPIISPTAKEPSPEPCYTPTPAPALPRPGELTLENLLRTALLPVGTTMYVWGGGWNEADTGAGAEALTLGLSAGWSTFAAAQESTYDYNKTRYQIHDGLDCSGYLGWVIFNVFETQNATSETEGYVMSSTTMAETFSSYGWGEYLTSNINQWKPGDICSMKGHVWISLGMCEDGSVLLLHASPPGVRICGTRLADGSASQAIALAEQCMRTYYPDWFDRYPACDVGYNYLSNSKIMRWNPETLTDAKGIQELTANELIDFLFP